MEVLLEFKDIILRGDYMSDSYSEADYENTIIELFENMGWRHVYGPDIQRDYRDPLYAEELNEAIHRINPEMPERAIHA